ncbi:primosomal protein DnaI [Bacillus horti]|uniref:Primosomal protein DnaI n=1 Tax=Caldalkalibacillus horti TaxID=77523 RepID=A0ABT9VWV1_9BACI|nr:primosomal protein DnaI [Bacillus horti]MDQ0165287.1 primosomal protein DnaI [Bacillus horti]
MEPIKYVLQDWLRERGVSQEDIQKQNHYYLSHPIFQKWWQHHPEWQPDQLLPYMNKIKEFVGEQQSCQSCRGLHECSNMMSGHAAHLETYHTIIEATYKPCSYLLRAEESSKRHTLVKSHKIPKDIMSGSMRNVDLDDPQRAEAFEAVLDFAKKATPGEDLIGLYLYGPLGVGKSYLLGAACNALADRGIASYMVYSPDFFREMKGAIAEQNLEEKLQVLKEVPVLIFDDIGAENISAWARDEILGAILQYRVMEKLPTLYTSNYDYDQLEEHLSYSQKGGIEQLKAKRIMERIRHYTDAYFIEGRNRRSRA